MNDTLFGKTETIILYIQVHYDLVTLYCYSSGIYYKTLMWCSLFFFIMSVHHFLLLRILSCFVIV